MDTHGLTTESLTEFRPHRPHRLARLVKRSFTLAGHRTSVALEPEFWEALSAQAITRGQSVSAFVAEVDGARSSERPLASALRVAVLTGAR